ncbi:MAG: ATP synthase F1 subunit gamma [Erysipelotrichaceae bacterium]|nr:ATP synthase F1 subunit gamma [Erysipelotrichaceae bacterium]
MAKSKAAIKTRIKSINSTKKITGAMELVSSVKFQKQLKSFNMMKAYTSSLEKVLSEVLSGSKDVDSIYLKKNSSNKRFCFVFLSDLGLCGGYNINLLKLLNTEFSKDDELFVIGTNYGSFFKDKELNVVNTEMVNSDGLDPKYLEQVLANALDRFVKGEIGSIECAYTKFVNNVTFEPEINKLLPSSAKAETSRNCEVLIEPNGAELIDSLVPFVVNNALYNRYIQAKTTEQASRRFAMENATDNANELIESLTLEYNQARQAAITQEITEIVSGADAL